jgi:predicted nucleic acid-binding protein
VTDRYLLDTNIISDARKPTPDPRLADWMARRPNGSLFIASIVLGEIWRGILELDDGARKRDLVRWFSGPTGPRGLFRSRVLPFDDSAAMQCAELIAEGRRIGRPRSPIDMQIAAIAKVNGCALVTLNLADFAPVQDEIAIIDPRRQPSDRI